MKNLTFVLLLLTGMFFSACKKEDDSDNGDNNGGTGNKNYFSYTDIGPGLGSEWKMINAKRSDTGLWALYNSSNTDAEKLARYDFQSKQWHFWDFDKNVWDFDVALIGEDNDGNGAVIVESTDDPLRSKVRPLGISIDWDTEEVGGAVKNVALGWGDGPAFSNWVAASLSFTQVYQQTGTCCPQEWNKIDMFPGAIIQRMYASPRSDGYVLVGAGSKLYIMYSGGGAEISLSGNGNYTGGNVAWDTQTGIPYVLNDGVLYRINANPNGKNATAVKVADLTPHFIAGEGSDAIDIRNGTAFGPHGTSIELSNGGVKKSWIGEANPNNPDDFVMAMNVSTSPYFFIPPNDNDGVIAYVRTIDLNTSQFYETWVRVNSAL